ncbi:MAG: plasmid stabilization protein [Novosphingobium sp. 17-62-19]|uniref:type II toxin-antitoxin system RelE/ParE family toxin n=1 Tax=Novosphingobium sp. 17-62-19 TaxID=1970406 RepID=UPI000BC6D529|nr:type II toxin-antitoxin system RelE/ParE family toxin [Novosphingobium sp. 17-62-19]OZA18668.1 MAG: plasmid stabilization protein [Novosphingobium sp. 17-62-19]HQS97043.1 type II toxin-antitoxin system RelE/ParE family toxin [Novosphingobium sp.]
MPQIIYSTAAIRDLRRLRDFLQPKSADAARRAGEAIVRSVKLLGSHPHIGRMVDDLPEDFREWVIDFGDSGYVARYRVDGDVVTVLAIRHQREAGFK